MTTERFELVERIGHGGMGTVWKARDQQTGELVALKILHEHLAMDPYFVERFEREVEVTRRIDSPYVARTIGFGRREGRPFIVMEFVDGKSLRDVLRERGPMTWAEAKPILRQIALGLEAAHRTNVIHRDVKPSNVLLTSDGNAKLVDFGIARAEDMTALTGTSTTMGTPGYMTPDGVPSKAADLYALGCVAYEVCTGKRAFVGDTTTEVAVRQMRNEYDLGAMPPEGRRFVAWLLVPTEDRRPNDASKVAAVLEGSSPVPRVQPSGNRRPLVLGGAAVAAVAFLTAALVFGVVLRPTREPPRAMIAEAVGVVRTPPDGVTGGQYSVGPFIRLGSLFEIEFRVKGFCAPENSGVGWGADVGSSGVLLQLDDGTAAVISGGTGIAIRDDVIPCGEERAGTWLFTLPSDDAAPVRLIYPSPSFLVEIPPSSAWREPTALLGADASFHAAQGECFAYRPVPAASSNSERWCSSGDVSIRAFEAHFGSASEWLYVERPFTGWLENAY